MERSAGARDRAVAPRLAGQDRGEVARLPWSGEPVPLRAIAPERQQRVELPTRLDALRHDRQAQCVTEAHHRGDDRGVLALDAEAGYEGEIDLYRAEREPLEVAERRVAGAEIVDRQPDTQRLQRGH